MNQKFYQERMTIIQKEMANKGLDGVLINRPEHIAYISGYFRSPCDSEKDNPLLIFIPREEEPILIAPEKEEKKVREKTWFTNFRSYISYSITKKIDLLDEITKAATSIIKELKSVKIYLGIESPYTSIDFYNKLKQHISSLEYINFSSVLEKMRTIKSRSEIELLKKVISLCDIGHDIVRQNLCEGISEIELFTKLRSEMEIRVGKPISLLSDFISGKRTVAMVGEPTSRKIQKADPVIVDLVPWLDGYWGDTTRTFVLGNPTNELKKIYQAVVRAKNRAINFIKPGVKASDVYKVVKDCIAEEGYGEYFPHHAGHGIGIFRFDAPLLVPYNDSELKDGMVITIEPGIYVKGVGGVRIEDCICVTKDGVDLLSYADTNL